jgi:predicted nucleic acid-binding protein
VAALVDTNVLVYLFDRRYPEKMRIAERLVSLGLTERTIALAHQTVVEFFAVTIRAGPGRGPLLTVDEAAQEVDELMLEFPVLYPNDGVVRLALRGAATYRLPWYDAHLWAYAEYYGLETLFTEDFQAGRIYGSVRIVNPFAA